MLRTKEKDRKIWPRASLPGSSHLPGAILTGHYTDPTQTRDCGKVKVEFSVLLGTDAPFSRPHQQLFLPQQ